MKNKSYNFSLRKLIVLINAFSFLLMVISGIVLFFVPQGRIAYWIEWKFIFFTKNDWVDIHTASWFLFLICSFFHIYYNFKPLKYYLINRAKSIFLIKKEAVVSILIVFIFVLSAILKIPPIGLIINLNEEIKNFWANKPNYDPPFGHAEEVSLKTIAKRMSLDLKLSVEELKKNGIVFEDENELIKEIALKNRKTPKDIYSIISKFKIKEEKDEFFEYTSVSVEEKYTGTGIGKKTLKVFCDENKIDIDLSKEKLYRVGIEMKEEDTFKEIAEKYKTKPIEILKVILIKNYKPK